MRLPLLTLIAFAFSACSEPPPSRYGDTTNQGTDTQSRAQTGGVSFALPRDTDLPAFFDCVRERGGVLIAAHRGAYGARGYPENALETLRHTFDTATPIMEVDVAQTRDGVLFLFHDDELRRMTGESGEVKQTNWNTIKSLKLRDANRRRTAFSPPLLSDALAWAVDAGAVLELDIKRSAKYADVIRAVRKADARSNVILISYSDGQAAKLASLAPRMMLTASARSPRDVQALERRGINSETLIAWTGTDRPDPKAWRQLQRAGIEPAFGTLGRSSDALDKQYARDGDLSEFLDMADDGAVLIATDMADKVARAMTAQISATRGCVNH